MFESVFELHFYYITPTISTICNLSKEPKETYMKVTYRSGYIIVRFVDNCHK